MGAKFLAELGQAWMKLSASTKNSVLNTRFRKASRAVNDALDQRLCGQKIGFEDESIFILKLVFSDTAVYF